jgi:opacity protein-like surface antigen
MSAGIKVPFVAPGRAISRYAWIPNAFVPYAGGGIALVHYDFNQNGEFADFEDGSIFRHTFISTETTSGAYAAAGIDWQLWRHVALAFEGRYLWANAPLTFSFSGFEGIDLSGLRLTTGISIPF